MKQNCKACKYARAVPLHPGALHCMESPPTMVIVNQQGGMLPMRPVVQDDDTCARFVASGASASGLVS